MTKYDPEQLNLKSLRNYKISDIKNAMDKGFILEAPVTKCSTDLELEVNIGNGIVGKLPFSELEYQVTDKPIKSIHAISKVGKTVKFKVISMEKQADDTYICNISRKAAQEECYNKYIKGLKIGQIIDAVVVHTEKYGVFCDIGCGIVALLPTKNVCIAKFKDPVTELKGIRRLKVIVQSIDNNKITLSHKELLGTWEEEASKFKVNDTVTGVVRLITDYGVFVELTPNLIGLAEVYPDVQENDVVSVFIRGFVRDTMKVKLLITNVNGKRTGKIYYKYRIPTCGYVKDWVYSPDTANKKIESHFDVSDEVAKLIESEANIDTNTEDCNNTSEIND